jgi:SsrA-binding protein
MAMKKKTTKGIIANRRASFDYALGDRFSFGVVLSGPEVKALRNGRGNLQGAFITAKADGLYLNNATITLTGNLAQGAPASYDPTQSRKLLAGAKEIKLLKSASKQGNSIVPTVFTTNTRFIKLQAALGKGRKNYDKRDSVKRKDENRINARLATSRLK